jgi:CheY-like chemotaxis protein
MKKKALVIDDNANNLELEKDLLEVAGFEVLEAVDASSGIAIAIKEKPEFNHGCAASICAYRSRQRL